MSKLPVSNRRVWHAASLCPLQSFASMIDRAAPQCGTWIRRILALASLVVVVGLTSCEGGLIDYTPSALDSTPAPSSGSDAVRFAPAATDFEPASSSGSDAVGFAPAATDFEPASSSGSDAVRFAPAATDFEPASSSDSDAVRVTLATTDLGVGPNRLAFALIDDDSGPIRGADALVSTFFLGGGQREGPIQTARAVWRRWPIAQSGLYTANFDFPRPGLWGIAASFVDSLGATRTASARFDVPPKSSTPSIGEPSPRSITKLARDYDDIRRITSDPEPDPELYALTVADAIDERKPFVVTFSTPAFCRSGTCGPQLDVVKDLKDTYEREANFIHVEVYDNPIETHPDFSNARIVRTMTEWGLPTEPWTFVIDAEGNVAAKFEAFATKDELDEALRDVLP